MAEKIERSPNWHHTLYYKRNFEQFSYTYQWREHPAMFVPLPFYDHVDLHNAVKPVVALPSRDLAAYALRQCDGILADADPSLTRLEAFTSVRDELQRYGRCHRGSTIGEEASQYGAQFTAQLEFMSDVPILGRQWTEGWMLQRQMRIGRKLTELQASES